MSFVSTTYFVILGLSCLFCVINIIAGGIQKKIFRMIIAFIWLLFVLVSAGVTWIYFQDFIANAYNSFAAEIKFVLDGVHAEEMMARIVLGTNICITLIAIVYTIVLIQRVINGIKNTAKKSADAVKHGIDNVNQQAKSLFTKKEKQMTETVDEPSTETEPVVSATKTADTQSVMAESAETETESTETPKN